MVAQLGSRANGPAHFQPKVLDPELKASKKLRAESPPQNPLPQRCPLELSFSPQLRVYPLPRAASPGLKVGRAFSPKAIRHHIIFRKIKSSERTKLAATLAGSQKKLYIHEWLVFSAVSTEFGWIAYVLRPSWVRRTSQQAGMPVDTKAIANSTDRIQPNSVDIGLRDLDVYDSVSAVCKAVVSKDVPDYALMVGVPAKQSGWMSRHEHKLQFDAEGVAVCPESGYRYRIKDAIVSCLDLDEDAPLPDTLRIGDKGYDEFKKVASCNLLI